MKKALSIVLSMLVILSMFGMVAAAADYAPGIVTVKFMNGEAVHKELKVMPGKSFVDRLQEGEEALGVPVKTDPEGKIRYTFECWENLETGERRVTAGIPAVPEEFNEDGTPVENRVVTYVAVFAEEDISENQTFWAFVQTIFERINKIFEYFAKVFEGIFE